MGCLNSKNKNENIKGGTIPLSEFDGVLTILFHDCIRIIVHGFGYNILCRQGMILFDHI